MRGLELRGQPHPIDRTKLPRLNLPPPYLELMAEWGPGTMCGLYEFPDPTTRGGRFDFFQAQLRVHGPGLHERGQWGQLTAQALESGVVLGVDRFGAAVFTSESTVVVLDPSGAVESLAGFELLTARHSSWKFDTALERLHPGVDTRALFGGVPMVYDTELDRRAAFLAAVGANDEGLANRTLDGILEVEMPVLALCELARDVAVRVVDLPAAVRASFTDQLLRMARRRAPTLLEHIPLRAIRTELESLGTLGAELATSIPTAAKPAGIFASRLDEREAALAGEVADHPDDPLAREIYADHLEDRGELERADNLRAALHAEPPIADAVERGFVPPFGLPPVDGAALLAGYIARWREDDPETSIDDLVARLEALHPQVRQGYAVLLQQVRSPAAWRDGPNHPAVDHLDREIADAWPLLLLSLRAGYDGALRMLIDSKVRASAPFVLSALLRPSPGPGIRLDLAASYVHLGKITPALLERYLPRLAVGDPVAYRILQHSVSDDRVFEGYLAHFVDAHPFSEFALKPRKREPRVIEALLGALAHEETRSLRPGQVVSYTAAYGVLARYLAKLGHPHGIEARDRYAKFSRWRAREDMS
jgi:uncharacterized protein (TIGR02996 family)